MHSKIQKKNPHKIETSEVKGHMAIYCHINNRLQQEYEPRQLHICPLLQLCP